jgi:peptide/nickel transport system ATP-binding protein
VTPGAKTILQARDLRVELADGSAIIEDVTVDLRPGEILGLVGESGSGKTTTARSLFGHYERGLSLRSGEITVAGQRLATGEEFRTARGRLLSYVPQNPGTSLNPSLRIISAIADMLQAHAPDRPGPDAIAQSVTSQLGRVGLPADHEFGRRYPHQLSGGQQQRVCIAIALSCDPAVVVLDEPTTGLDVVTQDRILRELVRLRDGLQVAMLYITHDLAVVGQIANRIAVMYAGRIVEEGPAREILSAPRHPYTRGLVASTPDHLQPRPLTAMGGIAVGVGERPPGCAFAPRCPQRVDRCEAELPALTDTAQGHFVRCFEWARTPVLDWSPALRASAPADLGRTAVLEVDHLVAEYRNRTGRQQVVRDVSFAVEQGACVALVGESGSGKTTIARAIAGLHPPAQGHILVHGLPLAGRARERSLEQRRQIAIVFQNPAEALNPRHTVLSSISRPAHILRGLDRKAAEAEARRLIAAVRLPGRVAERYPRELSGGERQRVAVARALVGQPAVLICDEVTSSLDVSVQAVMLELLRDLRQQLGISIVFISHDLGVVATVAERVLILQAGSICEEGTAAQVIGSPRHEYTKRLLEAAPSLSSTVRAWQRSSERTEQTTAVDQLPPHAGSSA